MLCFDRVIYNRLEHLDDEEEEDMGATQQLAVFAVRLTVTYKHPEALHDFALDDVARVPVDPILLIIAFLAAHRDRLRS